MLGGSGDAPLIPAELPIPIPGIEIVANLGAIPVGESPDAMARRLADEKFVFEAKEPQQPHGLFQLKREH